MKVKDLTAALQEQDQEKEVVGFVDSCETFYFDSVGSGSFLKEKSGSIPAETLVLQPKAIGNLVILH